jgi:hypothetical protein
LKRFSSLLFVTALSLVSTASAGTVFNSSLPTTGGDVFNDAAPGTFTVTQSTVDLLTSSSPSGYATSLCAGISCIDLDGTTSSSAPGGAVSSGNVINLTSPGVYTLTFDLFPAQRGTTASSTVLLANGSNTLVNTTYTDGVNTPNGLVTDVITINAANEGTYTLSFASNTPGYYGDLVGNVTVSSAVPEPSTLLLLSLPLLAFGSKSLRRSRS